MRSLSLIELGFVGGGEEGNPNVTQFGPVDDTKNKSLGCGGGMKGLICGFIADYVIGEVVKEVISLLPKSGTYPGQGWPNPTTTAPWPGSAPPPGGVPGPGGSTITGP